MFYFFPKEEGQTYLVADFIWGCAIGKVLNYFRTKDMHLKSRKLMLHLHGRVESHQYGALGADQVGQI